MDLKSRSSGLRSLTPSSMNGYSPRPGFPPMRRGMRPMRITRNSTGWRGIRALSRGVKSDSTITTIIRRGTYRPACFAANLGRRAPRRLPSGSTSGLGGIFHCYAGTIEEARRGMEMGFLVSFAGNVTYPKAQNLRDVARQIPLDRLLVETDSPFLAPLPHRGKRNEPAYVAEVARTIANVRDLATDEVASATAENFRRFFGLANSVGHDRKGPGGAPSHF